MNSSVKYTYKDDHLEILITPKHSKILAFGIAFEGTMYLIGAIVGLSLLIFIFTQSEELSFSWQFFSEVPMLISVPIICLVLGYWYLVHLINFERITCYKDKLEIRSQRKTRTYEVRKISHLEFSGPGQLTKHPLSGSTVDYNGFGVTEMESQMVIPDGSVTFFYEGRTIRFGKNVYSWDAEEILKKLTEFTGNDLTKDDDTEDFLRNMGLNSGKRDENQKNY